MIYALRHLIPSAMAGTVLPSGRWVRAVGEPFRGGWIDRLRDGWAVYHGRAFAVTWPRAGEYEAAIDADYAARHAPALREMERYAVPGGRERAAEDVGNERSAGTEAEQLPSNRSEADASTNAPDPYDYSRDPINWPY